MADASPTDPVALEFVRESLSRRMRTMHSLDAEAVATMELGQVNHVVAPGILPMAFPPFRDTNIHDAAFMGITGALPIWIDDWQARVKTRPTSSGSSSPRRTHPRWVARAAEHFDGEIVIGDDLTTITVRIATTQETRRDRDDSHPELRRPDRSDADRLGGVVRRRPPPG